MASAPSRTEMPRIVSLTLVFNLFLTLFFGHVDALGATDTITWGGDNSRAGYQTNHNMDPSVVGSSQFGQIFKTALPGKYNGAAEQIYSQPLVYTGADGVQYVYVATTQNNVYKIDAKTGAIVLTRNLHLPFLTADLEGCTDINPLVGITATGVIDPATDTLYLTSKTYIDQSQVGVAQGRPAGRYYLHAINTNDLTERPNFPVNLEGYVAKNNALRSFNGGIHHQRPALLHTGNFIYAGFASHCVQWNFTGWIMGWDKTTGANVERIAMEGAPVPNTTPGGGIWMSGGGLTSDDAGSIFFGTGNGYASQLATIPVNGRNPPSALEEAAVHMTIADDGSLTTVDFFMPWEKQQLDGMDKDLGTTPLQLLPSQFACGDIKRVGVITGKIGKTYFLNLDDLGGYRNGANNLDRVIQVAEHENSVYAGAGVYPLEGGYVYISVTQHETHVFKFACNAGVPSFTKVADSPTLNAYILGTGHGTVTSLNGQEGTGLLWTSDVQNYGLRIYNAVPQNGLLTQINQFNVPGVTKFSRPVFGDARVYLGTNQGFLYGFGSPVNLPLNCTTPVEFGTSNLNNQTAAKTVTCKANVAVTITNVTLTGDANFVISNVPAAGLNVAAGSTFTFQAAFNPKNVGAQSSDVVIATTNGVAGYSISTPVSLRGTGQSPSALLQVRPLAVTFPGVVAGSQPGGVNQTILFNNLGNAPLTITQYQYSLVSETGPWIAANQTASGPQAGPFTLIGLPTSIPGNSGATVIINFDTTLEGNFGAYINVISNGGTKVFDVVGTAGSAPAAVVEFQTPDGLGWVPYKAGTNFTFGNVTEQNTRSLKLRVTNNATTNGASLSLTVSKPPFGLAGIIGANNQVDLAEGTSLKPGESATATLYCSVPKSQWNVDPYIGTAQWTMNVNDANFGKQDIKFVCGAVSEQAAPLQPNGLGYYRYTGCYKENNPGRQLKQQLFGSDTNTNAKCMDACATAGYTFCATQYTRECWGGNVIPSLKVDEANCDFACTGDLNQICGGNGIDNAGSYMSLFADSRTFDGNTTTPSTPGTPAPAPGAPIINPGVGGFTSLGCYTEPTGARALTNQIQVTKKTIASCIAGCSALNSNIQYAGMEYGGECWCGATLNANSLKVANTDCSMPCNDNATEYCGAGSRLNLYIKGAAPTSLTSSSAASSTVVSSSSSTLGSSSSSVISSSSSVISSSSSVISSSSSVISSSSSAASSSTGTSSRTVSSSSSTGSSSSSTAASSSSTISSSSSAITSSSSSSSSTSSSSSAAPTPTGPTVKQVVGSYSFQGCYNEITVGGRALQPTTTFADDGMTLEACSAFCTGKTYFGVEYGRECYCGNTLSPDSKLVANQADCNFLCPGDKYSYCGAGNRIQLYALTPSASSSTSRSSTLSSSSSSSSLVSSSSSSSVAGSSSSSSAASTSASVTSSSSSSSVASSSSSSVASTSSSSSVIGSSSSSTVVSTASSSSSSSVIPTTSSSATLTSSSTRSSTTSTTATQTGPTIVPSVGLYNYAGCYTEGNGVRALGSASYPSDTLTVAACAASCSSFMYFGVEYGRECWCGNNFGTGALLTKDTDCSMTCAGDKNTYCGNGNRLNVYIKNGTIGGSSSSSSSSSTSLPSSSSSASLSSSSTGSSSSAASSSVSSTLSSSSSARSSAPSSTSSSSSSASPSSSSTSSSSSSVTSPSSTLTSSSSSSSLSSSSSTVPSSSSTAGSSSSSVASSSSSSSSATPTSTSTSASSTSSSSTVPSSTSTSSTFSSTSLSTSIRSTSSSSSTSSTSTSSTSSAKPTPTGPVVSEGNANFTYYSCASEPSSGRLLPSQILNNGTSMTISMCLTACSNYLYAGVEYGRECWCGNKLNTGTTSQNLTDSQCNFLCPGNSTEYCGAGSKMSLFWYDRQKAISNNQPLNAASAALGAGMRFRV
ncbi:Quinoprotein alcohol dehydrogenase-like protein [Glarea lozoyensis ATCC 20868]|uniref:Quinoprotein alcohol dehydrogenase-like protein n=1 Tax=Glarea lozoyensis (strain ATCC 20868 / MF5171) TaxID=1116229 RepID=S3DQA4_GLAL2|nr:Quinoprotein alcohol dehydrogenase-like protein [Glarea lozoyensis ATCC 20868]EPE28663.1 Quinoprotein alcohol dehydrogenase-like protein [Glarea lozoyensis ATCC 20868]